MRQRRFRKTPGQASRKTPSTNVLYGCVWVLWETAAQVHGGSGDTNSRTRCHKEPVDLSIFFGKIGSVLRLQDDACAFTLFTRHLREFSFPKSGLHVIE